MFVVRMCDKLGFLTGNYDLLMEQFFLYIWLGAKFPELWTFSYSRTFQI